MKYFILTGFLLVALFSCKEENEQNNKRMNNNQSVTTQFTESEPETVDLKYVNTKQDSSVVDDYFGEKIADPYRWLEDDRSEETAEWVKAQNEITNEYMSHINFRDDVRDRLQELYNYEKVSSPFKEGDYTYFYKNDGLQNQSVVYRKDEEGNEEVFLNPNEFSEDGTTSLSGMFFTKDGSRMAYTISEGGSDWRKVIVMDTETKEEIEDSLMNVKFSGISWRGNDQFYYASYDKPEGSELSAKTDQHKLYLHKVGTPQSEDKVVFGGSENEKHRYVNGYLTEDQRYFIVSASTSTSGNKLFIRDLEDENGELIPVVNDTDSDVYVLDNKEDTLYIVTNRNAPNQRVVKVNAANPSPENWEDVIPETENVLSASTGGGYLFAEYMVDALSEVKQYNYNGELVREIELPGQGSAGGFSGKEDEKELYFRFTNYSTPSSIYKYDVESGEYQTYWQPEIDFNADNYESKQVFYTSKDGTEIPMMITHKKGLEMNGNHPTILYGYGGFNISVTPSFNSLLPVWLEQGGIYAVPNLRGGGEYGKEWHQAGTQMKKQNVFDDFIAAAEYLIDQNYTSSEKLAISGRSNGGLLVGATMTQRPDLMKVALPGVGVLDMLRYHTFTAGAGWAYDYGTSEQSKEMFEYLYNYSPVHNVEEGTEYPATMVYTADHDDRVVPAHSFKFISELQNKHAGENPVLIRIETDSGHGSGKPTSKLLDEWADLYSFTMYNVGVEPNYD